MTGTTKLALRRGTLHLSRAVYDRHFAGLAAVMLLRQGPDLLILPVRHAPAGGYLLKLRNAAGDRVVAAMDFFRAHGIDDRVERELTAGWDETRAALVLPDLFITANLVVSEQNY